MPTDAKANLPLLSNEFVTCYTDYLVIHLYYFPFGNKKVKYSDLLSCELHSTDNIGMFEYKLWGMSLSPIWWHCDMQRLMRKYYILLKANQWPQIGLTMNDNDTIQVFNLIQQKMHSNQKKIHDNIFTYDTSKTVSEKELEHQKSLKSANQNE